MNLTSDQYGRFVEAAFAGSDDCIKVISLDGGLSYMSDGGQRVMEVDDFARFKGCPWPDFWHGQGCVEAAAAIERARRGQTSRFTGFANTAKGSRRYWDVKVSPIFAEDGTVENILSISRDITALKAHEIEQDLLRHELSHRIKNLLALVQSVANQTLRPDQDLATAKASFLGRLHALSRAQDVFFEGNRAATNLCAAIASVLEAAPKDRILVEGPEIPLSTKSGLAFALALHELMTNAVKYGAWSNEIGTVNITWQIIETDHVQHLDFTWLEQGGPRVTEPRRTGFGSRMIEKALVAYVRGHATVTYHAEGLLARLTAPLDALIEP